MPGNLIHRERTPPGEPVGAVVVRIGRGPAVVNVDDPTGGFDGDRRPRRPIDRWSKLLPNRAHGGGEPCYGAVAADHFGSICASCELRLTACCAVMLARRSIRQRRTKRGRVVANWYCASS